MSDMHTQKELRMAVEKQGQALLNAMARISSGELDYKVDIPEGVEILRDLGYGLTYLAEDMKLLLKRQKELAKRLEKLKAQQKEGTTTSISATTTTIAPAVAVPAPNGGVNGPFLPPTPVQDTMPNGTGPLPLPSTGWLGNSPLTTRELVPPDNDPLFDSTITKQPNFDSPVDVLGFLGFEPDQDLMLSQEESSALEDIAEQFGLALENQMLFEQTQQALTETELLYQISALLNQAESSPDILSSISTTISDVDSISLWIVPPDNEVGKEVWLELIENWTPHQDYPMMPVGSKVDANNYSFLTALLDEGKEAALVENINTDIRTSSDKNLQLILEQFELVTYTFLPLMLGNNLLGLMVLGWGREKTFSKRDQPLFQAIAAQVATALNNIRQLQDTKDRADQFATLATLEAELNQSNDEETVIRSLSRIFPNSSVTLFYVTETGEDGPQTLEIQSASSVEEGLVNQFPQRYFLLPDLPGYKLWHHNPHDIIHVEDVTKDELIKAEDLPRFEMWNTKSVCIIPLFFAEAWQGLISITWEIPHQLTKVEQYIVNNTREPLSAVIANRRTRLAEQRARRETEQLYAASQALNRAANSLSEILAVSANLIPQASISKVFLLSPELNEDFQIVDLETTTSWSNGSSGVMPNGTRIGNAAVSLIREEDRVFFLDTSDETLPSQMKRLLKRISANSICIVPLRLGPEISGYLLLATNREQAFDQKNIWILESIAPQISVAIQNSSLLADAQARARREELLREISEKIRGGADIDSVMKTAVSEIGRVLGRKAFLYLKSPGNEEEN